MRNVWFVAVLALLFAAVPCAAGTVRASGTVVDASGSPVAGARVRAILEHPKANEASVKQTAVAGADGSFVFEKLALPKPWSYPPNLPAEEWHCYLVADLPDGRLGWAHYITAINIRTGTLANQSYKIVLLKPAYVEGRVIDKDGAGVAGAVVTPTEFYAKDRTLDLRMPALGVAVPLKSATSGADGNYRLEGVPEGMLASVQVEKDGLAMRGPEKSGSTTIVMIPGGSIAGHVVDEHGKPIAGATVQAQASSSQPQIRQNRRPGVLLTMVYAYPASLGTATTQADGSYTIRGLNTLRYDLTLLSPLDKVAKKVTTVAIKAGETVKAANLIATAGTFISGRVLDADTGKPIADARVRLDATRPDEVLVDGSGAYRLRVLPESVTVQYSGGNLEYLPDWDFRTSRVQVPPAGLKGLDIHVKHAELATGRVVDEAGKPVGDAQVFLYGADVPRFGRTDSRGDFSIWVRVPKPGMAHSEVGPGEIGVYVASSHHDLGIVQVVKRDALIEGSARITVRPPHKLDVVVKGPDGAPLKGASASISTSSGLGYQPKPISTDETGRLRFEIYAGDCPSLYIFRNGYHQKGSLKLPAAGSPDWKDTVEVTMAAGNSPSIFSSLSPHKP